jgi:hypothetical protein
MFPKSLKSVFKSVLPRAYLPEFYLPRLVRERTGMRVIGGSFEGLTYVGEAVGSVYIPKLLGIYERELHPVIEEIVREKFEMIIDVGAAEGYYAVGLARRLPHAKIVAFERMESGRALLSEMATANGVVDRLVVRGECGVLDLKECLGSAERPLLICDVEGYEAVLLDPSVVSRLENTFVLVELHEFLHEGITQLIKDRFRETHRLQEIAETDRSPSDFPFRTLYTRLLPGRFMRNAVSEWRPERMTWLWMRPVAIG